MKGVANPEHARSLMRSLAGRRKLFAFFLFDDRPSQQGLQRFAEANFGWLDSLAGYANIFGFVFLDLSKPQLLARLQEQGLLSKKSADEIKESLKASAPRNPSLAIARMFGLRPNQLPGVVIFSMTPDGQTVGEAAYLPLRAELFEQEPSHVEEILNDLFAILAEAQKSTEDPSVMLETVRKRLNALRRTESQRPVVRYMRGLLVSILAIPLKFTEEFGKAFGAGSAQVLLGK